MTDMPRIRLREWLYSFKEESKFEQTQLSNMIQQSVRRMAYGVETIFSAS
jgi:hypothetical protein